MSIAMYTPALQYWVRIGGQLAFVTFVFYISSLHSARQLASKARTPSKDASAAGICRRRGRAHSKAIYVLGPMYSPAANAVDAF
jgi:hypothetical protein